MLCGLLCLLPDADATPISTLPRASVRVQSVDNSGLYPIGIVYSVVQTCEVTVLDGAYQGQTALAGNYLNSALDKDKLFEPGDTAWAMIQSLDSALHVTLIDHDRRGIQMGMVTVLAIALVLFGGVVGCGALMDLSMDISVSCEEILYHRPDLSGKALLKSGLTVGRGVLGTMTTTLMLAYSGNYLSILMYFAGQGTLLTDVINLKYVSSQLLNTLVGSFRLVAAAPLSALAASVVYLHKRKA